MIQKKLPTNSFGKIKCFETSFGEQVTEISDFNKNDIITAIGLATKHKSLISHITDDAITDNTKIVLELNIAGHPYMITARGHPCRKEYHYEVIDKDNNTIVDAALIFRNIRLCEEEESLVFYWYNPREAYDKRFLHYKDPDKYYTNGEFKKRTNGLGLTRSFRAYLAEYIKNHDICNLLLIGRFMGGSVNGVNSITDLGGVDKKLFDYKCYLAVNDFWTGFENIRDMNHEKWPIIIDAEDLYEHKEFKELLAKPCLERQMIVMGTN